MESIGHRILESMLTTPHDECLAIDGIMYRRNCRPSRFRWRHQLATSIGATCGIPRFQIPSRVGTSIAVPPPADLAQTLLIRPRISTNKGWDTGIILVPCLHGSPRLL
jgi:hypothetical protein